MIPYCSRTGTKTTLAALRNSKVHWRLLISATGVWNNHGFKYAVDNGAFTAYNQKLKGLPGEFDGDKFLGVLEWAKNQDEKPDWVVVPDIVADHKSADFSKEWMPVVQKYTELPLLAVQDGMTTKDAEYFTEQGAGIFLGGSTEFKLGTMNEWGEFCAERKAYFHVGRVNTQRRIRRCYIAKAHSFDGTCVAKFPSNQKRLESELIQRVLF